MQKLIHKLFDSYIKETPFPLPKNNDTYKEEWEFFNRLYAESLEPLKQAFLDYVKLRDAREKLEQYECYKEGFKTAVRLITESLKDEE